jgi:hypothetical protein
MICSGTVPNELHCTSNRDFGQAAMKDTCRIAKWNLSVLALRRDRSHANEIGQLGMRPSCDIIPKHPFIEEADRFAREPSLFLKEEG